MSSIITPDTSLSLADAIALLSGEDTAQRYYAAWYLGYLQDPLAVEALIEALHDESDRTELGGYPLRRKAAESLGRIGDLRAVPALIEALQCEDIYVREMATWSLAELKDQRAIEPLMFLLRSEAPQPYEALIEALGDLQVTAAVPLIQPYVENSSERLRCAAARSLYRLTGEPSHIEILFNTLRHGDVHIRRAALFDLGKTGYLPAAAAIAGSQVTANLKLYALKELVDASREEDSRLTPVLNQIDALI